LALYTALSTAQGGHALLLFPYQNREHAQLAKLTAWNDTLPPAYRLSAAIYDGNTPPTQRRTLRQSPPRMLLTTPEMLHAGILAYHSGWRTFFQNLRVVVLADAHLCAGALGAHMTHLLARVQRISSHYGSQPQYLMTTEPVANLHDVAHVLLGHPCAVVIGESLSRHPQSRVLVKIFSDVHNAPNDMITVLRTLFAGLQESDAPPLVLVPPETVWDGPLHALEAEGGVIICQGPVSREAYQGAAHQLLQGGYGALVLPHDTPTATIRPTGIRSIIFLGLPSSLTLLHDYLSLFASTHPHSLSLLLLTDTTPLERYVLRYPAVYQTHWLQALGFHPSNPQVAQRHLLCAAAELALGAGEPYVKQPGMPQLIEQLAATQALVRRTATGDWITTRRQMHRRVRLRAYEPSFAVVHELDGQLLTRVRPGQAFRSYFEGAIFTHEQQQFHVERLLTDRYRILVRSRPSTSVTRGIVSTDIAERRLEASFSNETFRLSTGGLSLVETLQGYERLDLHTYRRTSVHGLPAHRRQLRTQATWLDFLIPAGSLHFSAQTAMHTFMHAILAGLPLLWLADSIPGAGVLLDKENTENVPGVVLFDESAGGNGVSTFLYHAHTQVWRLGLQILLQCDCDHGCSHCITGHTCDVCAQEVPLDRQAGIALFQRLLGEVAPALEQVRLPAPTTVVLSQEHHRPRHLYLCLTTQKSADEVGGWQHRHLLGLGVAVTYDTQDGRYRVYTAETVDDLLASLCLADLVIGFNLRDFDYQVLQPYTTASLAALPTLAILDKVQEEVGYRLSFSHLVQETLGIDRPDESLQTLQWFRQGERNRIVQYCQRDITHLRALVRHGAHTGHVWYRDRTDTRQAFAVNWQFAEHDG
jgi:DEAD/DEAH box helicase domain-containing protein